MGRIGLTVSDDEKNWLMNACAEVWLVWVACEKTQQTHATRW